jgi:hypothetical protein
MYSTHEIFTRMPPAASAQLFAYIGEKEKALMKATIETLCKQRKLRPVFVERKPKVERIAWLRDALGRKQNEAVAANLLQIWLVGSQSAMLCEFLDGLGIAHDEHGTIEELPPAPPKEKLAGVVNTLLGKYDQGTVAVYLHAFQATDEKGWDTLKELLAEDPRLKLQ